MRITIFLLLVSILQTLANDTYSQVSKLSLDITSTKLVDVLDEIEEQSEFYFLYNEKLINTNREVSINVKNERINGILDELFEGTDVLYSISDRKIILAPSYLSESELQQKSISGTVIDEFGEPLPGVTVIVKGTAQGTVTNADGEYSLANIPEDAVLQFSFIGMQMQEISVGNQTKIDLTMLSDAIGIEEVVAIGYGTQKKADLTGAVASVRIADMQKITASQTDIALQGKVAGVNVIQSDQGPGNTADIRVRGIGTLNNHQPLVIVDGVPSSMDVVDPKDIESIDILKDAASAAIYGSRAANGVIIISTKRGIGGDTGKTKVNYRGYSSFESREKSFGLINDASTYVDLVKLASDNMGQDYPPFVAAWENDPSQFGNSNWEDAMFGNAFSTKHVLSVSRSGKGYNVYVSSNLSDEEGIRAGSEFKRFGIRINSDFTLGRLKLGESFAISRKRGDNNPLTASDYNFTVFSKKTPLHKVYDPSTPSGYGGSLEEYGFKSGDNPVRVYEMGERTYDDYGILASAYGELEIFKNLKYKLQISQETDLNSTFGFSPTFYTDGSNYSINNSLGESASRRFHNILDQTLSYSIDLGKHDISALVGISEENTKFHSMRASAKGSPSNNLKVLDAFPEDKNAGGREFEHRLSSQFARMIYSYDDKYLFQANIRRDGSSRFPKENRWGVFPSASLGWRINKEPFLKDNPTISNLKLRASYGELGMQEVGNYAYLPQVASDDSKYTNYPFGLGPTQTISIGSEVIALPSVGLKWEETKTTNIGLDIGLWKDKLTLEADYYVKKVEDILYRVQIPLSVGSADSPTVNSASIDNKGFDLALNWRSYENTFKYEATLTLASNKNKVVRLGDLGNESIVAGEVHWSMNQVTRTVVGSELGEFYLFKTDGIFNDQAELDAYKNKSGDPIMPSAQPGDVKIVDTNDDGTITDDDKIFMGSGLPKAELGFTFNMSYKNFDANIFLHSILGAKKINGGRWLTSRADEWHGFHKDLFRSWTPQNMDTDIPRMVTDQGHMNYREHDMWLEDASYLRLKHIEVGYTLPDNLLGNIGLDNIRIYLAGDNLFTLTKYTGWDPGGQGGGAFGSGVDRWPYPVSRKFVAGLELSF